MTYRPKPGEVVTLYFVSYVVPDKKKWQKSRYRMHPSDAAERYAKTEYRLEEFDSLTITSPAENEMANIHAHFSNGRSISSG